MLKAHQLRQGILESDAVPDTRAVLQETVAEALADRYDVERLLGEGGMASVFLAHEKKHGRRVVIKVLKPQIAARYGVDRFLREVRIAARLAHPHILGLIDSGEARGLLYYVMPYVEGETLRQRLDRAGPLPIRDALSLLRDLADASGACSPRRRGAPGPQAGQRALGGEPCLPDGFRNSKAGGRAGARWS